MSIVNWLESCFCFVNNFRGDIDILIRLSCKCLSLSLKCNNFNVDAPVILTLPHMLGASNEYRKMIRGLKPDAKKHQTFVDVQSVILET